MLKNSIFSFVSEFQSQSLFLYFWQRKKGLKVNSSKSDVLWLGSERNVQEMVLDFRLPKDFVYSLGVYFSYNSKVMDEKNFHSKLGSLKSLLRMWKMRNLTLYGKIQIIKTLALTKIIFICSVLPSPVNFEKEINSLTFSFIWSNKPAKIKKKSTLIADKRHGGLKMIDFTQFSKAVKAMWAKRLSSETKCEWHIIRHYYLENVEVN